uniref:Uncharacterized protein n=1 Tax=Brassica oleracea var. oleracea TaxID=109376 RepID=A0A0D3A566_BRAOL
WKYRRRTQLYPLTDYAGGLKAGRRLSSGTSSSNKGDEEDVNVDLTEQKKANDVKVSEVNHGMAPPSHLLDSEIPQKPKSETGLRGDGETPLSSRRADRETMMFVADGTIEVNFGD